MYKSPKTQTEAMLGRYGLWAALLAALTLGLAPFTPEPHVVGKLRWLFGGAQNMGAVDVFDLLLHGAPWCWLSLSVARRVLGSPQVDAPRQRQSNTVAVAALTVCLLLALGCVLWALFSLR